MTQSSTTTTPSAATTSWTSRPAPSQATPSLGSPRKLTRTLRKSSSIGPGLVAVSTPNLNALYTSHSQQRFAPPRSLARKASLAALTSSTLATIPDATESYAFSTSVLSASVMRDSMAPLTPGRPSTSGGFSAAGASDLAVGDTVDVPGNMFGTVRFVGPVQGKKGIFAGVELFSEYASRGKNSGDVDG